MNDPDEPDAGDAKAKAKVEADIQQFKDAVANADVEYIGKDTEYVPDGPHAREGHPNVDGGSE